MEKKPKEEIKTKKKADPNEQIGFQSFLIPKHYRNQSVYRNHIVFRFSLFLVMLVILAGLLTFFQWQSSKKATEVLIITQNIETEESGRLQAQSNSLRPVRDKFKELESLRRQLRVPLGPVLDAIEKTIPQEVSLNRFTSSCPPIASTSTLKRKMQIQMEVFFPAGTSSDNPIVGAWPETLAETLQKNGLLISDANWGPEREFKRLNEDSKKRKVTQAAGNSKELNLTVELSPE
jgi:hypothetical protein